MNGPANNPAGAPVVDVDLMPKRAAFIKWAAGRALDVTEDRDRRAVAGETLAVVTFGNVEALDVLLAVVQRIRGIAFPDAPPAGRTT